MLRLHGEMSKNRQVRKNYLLIFAAAFASGVFLYGAPTGPDSMQGWVPVLGAFCLFGFFLLSAFMWGTVFTRFPFAKEPDVLLSLVAGLGAYALAGEILSLLGLIGYFRSGAMLLFFFSSVPAFYLLPAAAIPKVEAESFPKWPALTAGLLFLFFFALSWIPDSMPDPLWYHLSAARAWSDHGGYTPGTENAAFYQSGAWDALLLWGNFLLGSAGDGGLVAGQFFGQWLHLLGAAVPAGFMLYRLFGGIFPALTPSSRAFLTLAAMTSAAQVPSLSLAKNDWGASLFLFSAFWVWFGRKNARDALLAGVFFGLAVSTKASVGFGALILFGVAVSRRPGKLSHWIFFAGSSLLSAFPWLLRNQIALGDPFFPALQSLFPALVGPSWEKFSLYYEGAKFGWAGKGYLAREVLRDSPYTVLVMGCLFLPFFRKIFRRFTAEWMFCALSFAAAVLFCLKTGARAEYRLFGPACFLLISSGLGFAFILLEKKFTAPGIRTAAGFAAIGLSVAYLSVTAQFPWRAPMQVFAQARPAEEIRRHFGGTALAWIRLNIQPGKIVASANDHRLYYLADFHAFRIWDRPALDRALYEAKSIREVVAALRRERIDYLIFTRMDWDSLHRREVLDSLEAAWYSHPGAVVFGNEHSKVIDLARLQSEL